LLRNEKINLAGWLKMGQKKKAIKRRLVLEVNHRYNRKPDKVVAQAGGCPI
jgi:hypothetical protein